MDTSTIDPAEFIRTHLTPRPLTAVPEVRLHIAHERTGLARLHDLMPAGEELPAPYWAHPWGGGTALARYLLDNPQVVAGKRVLDFGSGSGLVGIAAALSGAAKVMASETDPFGRAATGLNAELNAVRISMLDGDLLNAPLPEVDLLLAGDVFYTVELAVNVLFFLRRVSTAGIDVLIGDPGRAPLPRHALNEIATYDVPDFGDSPKVPPKPAWVFTLR